MDKCYVVFECYDFDILNDSCKFVCVYDNEAAADEYINFETTYDIETLQDSNIEITNVERREFHYMGCKAKGLFYEYEGDCGYFYIEKEVNK